MDTNWAAEHLQVIRTLMERSALYRRALAPVMIFNGVLGLAGGALGWALQIGSVPGFVGCWAGVALLGADLPNRFGPLLCFHGVMGAFFGALHLAYGIYLYFTERPGNEA